MKKTLIAVLAVALLVTVFGTVGSVYAMGDTGKGPGNGGGGNGAAGTNGTSILSSYMTDAVAAALGVDDPAVIAARLDAGETFYDIAISMGYTDETWPALFESVKEAALASAAADGLTPQQQDQLNSQLNTNLGTQSQLYDGTCDGTGDCLQTDSVPSLYTGANGGTRGRRGGR